MKFEIIGNIQHIETIASGSSIRILALLKKRYGKGKWYKKKGVANIKLVDGTFCQAEIHWYEAHGIGKKDIKIKYLFTD